nr:ribonuclease H-like domain-containing protein [Tanacetum cinerariifolium]
MFLSQRKYTMVLLELAHMANCNSTQTLVVTESKLGYTRDLVSDPTLYGSLAGGLQPGRGENLLSRFAKRQHSLSRSSAEARYMGATNVVVETDVLST